MVRYCCAINGTQSPADIESVVGIVPLLSTQILADMIEEEAKAEGFNSLEEFRKAEKQQEQSTKP